MKTIAELEAIRQKTLARINMRKEDKQDQARVVVGMATCGIAAGARPVLLTFMEEIEQRNLHGITVSQTGCIGMCRFEPMADIIEPSGKKVTYVKLDPHKVRRIVAEHLVNGQPVLEYTIGAAQSSEAGKE